MLHFVDYGGGGEIVVLLHGLGSRGLDWQPQIMALKNHFRIITVDFPGHGESAPSKPSLTMADLAKEVVKVLDQLELESVNVVGLSLGGMVGFQMAVDYPHRLKSMVIVNSAPGLGKQSGKLKRQLWLRKFILRLVGIKALAKKIAKNLFPEDSQEALRQQFMQSIDCVDGKTYGKIVDAISDFELGDRMEDCSVPTLVLAADQDYTSVAFKQAYARRMRCAQVCVIPHSRHASPLDSPDFCNEQIRQFLQSKQHQ